MHVYLPKSEAMAQAAEAPATAEEPPVRGETMLVAQSQRRHPGVKSLFMTGYAPESMSHQARLPQGAALLNKPFTRHELARKVRAVLDG